MLRSQAIDTDIHFVKPCLNNSRIPFEEIVADYCPDLEIEDLSEIPPGYSVVFVSPPILNPKLRNAFKVLYIKGYKNAVMF